MSHKDSFIALVERLLNTEYDATGIDINGALDYFNWLKTEDKRPHPIITESGAKVLQFMQRNRRLYNNVFKAKEIAEGLDTSSHSVSGSMRKLVAEGFVEKIGQNPVAYSITDKGIQAKATDYLAP